MAYRRRAARPPEIPVEELPDWLLRPPTNGIVLQDRHGIRVTDLRGFQEWRKARADFLAEHGLPYSWRDLRREYRRRVEAHWAAHPEDRIRPPKETAR